MKYVLNTIEAETLQEFQKIEEQFAQYASKGNFKKINDLSKERSKLEPVVTLIKLKKEYLEQLNEIEIEVNKENDSEIKRIILEEKEELTNKVQKIQEDIQEKLKPKDPNSGKNIFIEIHIGTGGEEATLFARDLFRMYIRFLEKQKMKYEIVSLYDTGIQGLKEAIILVKDHRAYDLLNTEAGVHRVQRIPTTESQGRIHTSACKVAVIPEVEEKEIEIQSNDIRVDVFRSSGPGGQSVNTTDSAVRITHFPTGIVVSCQDEKSQHKNKAKAMKILRIRLMKHEKTMQDEKMATQKKQQMGSGDRSDKIRTYNFPQNRVTDHRINFSSYNLDKYLEGDIYEILGKLEKYIHATI